MKYVLLFLLLLPAVHAVTVAEWPDLFIVNGKFDALYVVGEDASSKDVISATVISTSLARYENVTTKIGTSTVDTAISNITRHDAVVVGSPCDNTAAYELLGRPDPCYTALGGGIGYIMVFEHNGRMQLLITGLSEVDRSAAAKALAEDDLTHINAAEYLIQSHSNSSQKLIKQLLTKNETNVTLNETVNETAPTPEVIEITPPEPEPPIVEPEVVEYGEYEPLEMPEKEGWWARFWAWIKGLFT